MESFLVRGSPGLRVSEALINFLCKPNRKTSWLSPVSIFMVNLKSLDLLGNTTKVRPKYNNWLFEYFAYSTSEQGSKGPWNMGYRIFCEILGFSAKSSDFLPPKWSTNLGSGVGLNPSSTHRLSSLHWDVKMEKFDMKTKFREQSNGSISCRNLWMVLKKYMWKSRNLQWIPEPNLLLSKISRTYDQTKPFYTYKFFLLQGAPTHYLIFVIIA
jgi:hypothetical protein